MPLSRRINISVFLLLLLTFIIWSNSFIAIGILKPKVSAMELVVLRFVPVGLISTIITAIFFRRQAWQIARRHPWRLAAMGFLTVISYNLLLNAGMSYVSPSASSLLVSLNPLFTLFLAVRFLKEPYTGRRLAGTILSLAGLAVVVTLGKVGVQTGTFIPADKIHYAVMVMLAALSWASYTILLKPLLSEFSPLALNYVVLSTGCLPLYFMITPRLVRTFLDFSPLEHFSLAFLSLGCTIIAFALWAVAVKYWKASNVSLFVYLNPPLTAVFAWLFFLQLITGFFFAGGLLMLSGIVLATFPGRKTARTATPDSRKT